MLDRVDIPIEVLDESDEYREEWYTDEESYESEVVLRDSQDDERDKNREVDVWRDDFRIQIVCLDSVYYREHHEYTDDCRDSAISVRDDDDRDPWYDRPKYRDKTKYKNNQCERDNIRESPTPRHESDDDESKSREYRVHECDDRLRSKYDTKSISDLSRDDRIFIIEKCEVAITHTSEKELYFFSFDDKYIREDESEEELHEDESTVRYIGEDELSDRFEVFRRENIFRRFLETEIEGGTFLEFIDNLLSLTRYDWSFSDEFLDIGSDLRHDGDKDKSHNRDKEYIEDRHDDIGGGVFGCEFVWGIAFSFFSPVMELVSDHFACLEEYICTDKYDEKKCHKVCERQRDDRESRPGDEFFPEFFREYDREESADHRKRLKNIRILWKILLNAKNLRELWDFF